MENQVSRYNNEVIIDSVCEAQPVGEPQAAGDAQPSNIQVVAVQPVCPPGAKTWTPEVDVKPYKGQLFGSFVDAFTFYKEYARKSGFEVRKATTEQSRSSEGYSRRYIICNREGEKRKVTYDSLKDKRKRKRNRPSQRINYKACIRLKINVARVWEVTYFEEKHTNEMVNPEDFHFLKSNRSLTYQQEKTNT